MKAAKNKGVLSIGKDEDVSSLNLQNIDGALNTSRDNIIADIAAGSDVPPLLSRKKHSVTDSVKVRRTRKPSASISMVYASRLNL
ncbi:hypothetical protein O5268_16085 [Escherichia coli]|nr:hypothetical protein [Escherichia coli]